MSQESRPKHCSIARRLIVQITHLVIPGQDESDELLPPEIESLFFLPECLSCKLFRKFPSTT